MRRKISKNEFQGQSFHIGIDTHKKSWKVTILGAEYEHKTMSQNSDPTLLASYLKRNFPGGEYHAVYEAGFSGLSACRTLNSLGVNCIVIHPADVPTSGKERLQKSDKADSRKLAKALRGNQLDGIYIPDPQLESDRALIRQRFRVVKDFARTKNRIKSLLFQFGIPIPQRHSKSQTRYWSKNFMNWLKCCDMGQQRARQVLDNYIRIGEAQRKEVLLLTQQIRQLSQSPSYEQDYQLLRSVPGLGLITAMTILLELSPFSRFKRTDELCNYIGLVPSMYVSGEKMITGKLIKRGRKQLKVMLLEASWVAIRKDPALMSKFNDLSQRMNKNKAIIRIAKKLVRRIRTIMMNREPYQIGIKQ